MSDAGLDDRGELEDSRDDACGRARHVGCLFHDIRHRLQGSFQGQAAAFVITHLLGNAVNRCDRLFLLGV